MQETRQCKEHSTPPSLWLFYDGSRIAKLTIPLDRENLKSPQAILLHCPLQSSGLHSWKLAWKRKATARFLCWLLHLDQEPSGVCEQSLSAKPYLVEYRQELLSLKCCKKPVCIFPHLFPLGKYGLLKYKEKGWILSLAKIWLPYKSSLVSYIFHHRMKHWNSFYPLHTIFISCRYFCKIPFSGWTWQMQFHNFQT